VIPWDRDDIAGWKRTRDPENVTTKTKEGHRATIGNPVVEAALTALTDSVNLTTGITHPSDKTAAVEMFRILRSAGEDFDPEQIREWAVAHGWVPRHARHLAETATKIKDGRAVRAGRSTGKHWRDDILEQWRGRAKGDH
jgi:hypothetical protein